MKLLSLAFLQFAIFIGACQPAKAASPYDINVFSADVTHGWVKDISGNNIYGSRTSPQLYPLVWALNYAGPGHGRRIHLNNGQYGPVAFDSQAKYIGNPKYVHKLNSDASNFIQVIGDVDASGKRLAEISAITAGGTTISVHPGPFHYIEWYNVKINAGWFGIAMGTALNAAPPNDRFTSWHFFNSEINGGFDHKTQTGVNSKWGMLSYGLDDFIFEGGKCQGVRQQQCFYLHTDKGNVRIANNVLCEMGRSAIQIVARHCEGVCNLPANPGDIIISGNTIADTGIASMDGFQGGQSLTVMGRNTGNIEISNNTFSYGQDLCTPGLMAAVMALPAYPHNLKWGLGATVIWSDTAVDREAGEKAGPVKYFGNQITYCPTCQQGNAVSLSSALSVDAYNNYIRVGSKDKALLLGENNPSHVLPDAYCIHENHLMNGGKLYLNLIAKTQPQSLGMACP